MRRWPAVISLVTWCAVAAHGQQWFFNWDGTTDLTCVPTFEGNNAFFQGSAANSAFWWEIADNGSGGRAFRQVVTGGTGFRWYGYGSRPEFYRGPCTTFAMENLRADRNAFTITMRIKAESASSTSNNRFFNCEFETTTLNPFWPSGGAYEPYYGFRVEFSLRNDSSGDLWLTDFRTGQQIYKLRPAGSAPAWHTIWATCELPPQPYTTTNGSYRMWIDGTEVPWDDRDRGGWSDCEIGWTPNTGRNVTYALDYLCYTYGAFQPGSIAVPAERVVAPTNSIAALRTYPDGTPCELTGKVVAGIFTDPRLGTPMYYLCEPDGIGGIKVTHNTGKPPHDAGGSTVTLAIGNVVSLRGGLGSAEGEKQISAHDITYMAAGSSPAVALPVTNAELTNSCSAALYAGTPVQLLAVAETGTVGAVTTNTITDASRNWVVNQWKNTTVFLPPANTRPALYYYVIANTTNTLTLAHRAIRQDFNAQPNLVADGVQVGNTWEFVGSRPVGPRLDGRVVQAGGVVTAVNTVAGYFDVSDGGGSGDTRTLQDIWDTINYGYVFTPPNGIRVYSASPFPSVGDTAGAIGCAGAWRFKHQVTTSVDPNNSARDEVKIDKILPVIWGQTWRSVRITAHPVLQAVCPGTSAAFSVRATGSVPLTYQWQKDGADLTTGGHYAGVNTQVLTVSSVDAGDAGHYRCIVSADFATAASKAAALILKTVIAADLDQDCDVDDADTEVYSACASGPGTPYVAGCARADLDFDNDVDQSDFGRLQRCLSGASISPDPACLN